jgi:hypothetical protein
MDLKEPLWEKCKRVKIPWKTPAGTFAYFCWFYPFMPIRIENW